MIITPKQFAQIMQYINNNLSAADKLVVEKEMQTNKAFAEQVFIQQQIHDAITAVKFVRFQETLSAVQDAYHQPVNFNDVVNTPVQTNKTYSLQELLDFFKVVPEYEDAMLELATRSGVLGVVTPVIGDNFVQQVKFVLQEAIDECLKITIENSDEDIIIQQELAPNTQSFLLSLANCHPGRYYWKLKSDSYAMVLGSFFIQKGLMPK